jgi:sigma-E factor negative regulatory protein RseB
MRALLHVSISCCLLLMSQIAHADDEVTLLQRMDVAAKQLNYEGVFSYRTGKTMQAIRIIHRANQQGEIERLVSLNGVAREVIRNNEMMTCIYPEGKRVQPDHRPLGLGFPSDFLNRLNLASAYYQFSLGREERVAGHHTQELKVMPIDNYRYGYQLWVDKDSDLLLQSDLVDDQDEVLETVAFSSVEMGHDIPEELLQAQIQGNEMTWNRAEQVMATKKMANKASSPWQIAWMPEGFTLVAQQNRLKAKNGASIEQHVYSDGLNSISIFIEKIRAQHSHLRGGSKMGTTNAFGTIINSHFVTIVGEVPQRTVEKVGNSIQYVGHE